MLENVVPDEVLDCRNLGCPMPFLKTKKVMSQMKSGEILEVQSTGAGTRNDLPAFANRAGHEFLGEKEEDGFTRLYLKVR